MNSATIKFLRHEIFRFLCMHEETREVKVIAESLACNICPVTWPELVKKLKECDTQAMSFIANCVDSIIGARHAL